MQRESVYDRMTNSEKVVARTLKNLGIEWSYEQPMFVWDEDKRPRVRAPDFYLMQFGIYIEVCGSEHFDYEHRKRIFNSNGYKVIFLQVYKKTDLWMNHLFGYLQLFTNDRTSRLNHILQEGKI